MASKAMKIDKNLTNSLAQSAAVMNGINGGITMPVMSLNRTSDEYIFNIHLAGVNPDDFSVEIDSHNLFVYYQMRFDDDMEVPYMLQRLVIPANVNYEKIRAEFDAGKLRVVMPFNELANGYHRDVDIVKKY